MPGLLDGMLALVTGAGSGIGRGIAEAYAHEGARVLAADRDGAAACDTAARIGKAGGTAHAIPLDVSDLNACRKVAAETLAAHGPLEVLVNNAGIVRRTPVDAPSAVADWQATLSVNLDGAFHMTTAFLDQLVSTKGRIVNIGSIQSQVHTMNSVPYTVSKFGIHGLTKALAAELGPKGVRVNAIGPGLIETPLNAADLADHPERREAFMRHTPLRRPGAPEDVAGPAVFLASDLSRYVTGVLLPADGGYLTL